MSISKEYKLAIQSGLLRLFPLELAVEKIRAAGYDGVELWGGQLHGYIYDLCKFVGGKLTVDVERVEAVKNLIERNGLETACYTPEQLIYPLNFIAQDLSPLDTAAVHQRSRDLLRLSIEVAALLGCKRMVIVSQFWEWRKRNGIFERVPKAENLANTISAIYQLVRYAEEQSVTILFEPLVYHDSNGIVTFEDVAVLMNQIPSPNLQLMLDLGHVQVTAYKEGYEPLDYLRRHLESFSHRLGYIHLDDNPGTVDTHILPGEGVVNFEGMFKLLMEFGYRGWLSVELGILGEYALPENAEILMVKSQQFVSGLLERI